MHNGRPGTWSACPPSTALLGRRGVPSGECTPLRRQWYATARAPLEPRAQRTASHVVRTANLQNLIQHAPRPPPPSSAGAGRHAGRRHRRPTATPNATTTVGVASVRAAHSDHTPIGRAVHHDGLGRPRPGQSGDPPRAPQTRRRNVAATRVLVYTLPSQFSNRASQHTSPATLRNERTPVHCATAPTHSVTLPHQPLSADLADSLASQGLSNAISDAVTSRRDARRDACYENELWEGIPHAATNSYVAAMQTRDPRSRRGK